MNTEKIKLLKKTIKLWESIIAGKDTDRGTENDPLCMEYEDNMCK